MSNTIKNTLFIAGFGLVFNGLVYLDMPWKLQASFIDVNNFKEAYEASLQLAEEKNKAREEQIITTEEGVFAGYIKGRRAATDFRRKMPSVLTRRVKKKEENTGFLSAPPTPFKLTPTFTTMGFVDVVENNKYYLDVVQIVSLGILKPDKEFLFHPDLPVHWEEVLYGAIRAQHLDIEKYRNLRRLNLSSLRGVTMDGSIPSRVFYTALHQGLIDESFYAHEIPTREEILSILAEVFYLKISENVIISSFSDVNERQNAELLPLVVAAKKAGWFKRFPVSKNFNPKQRVTRAEFSSWFVIAFNQEVQETKEMLIDSPSVKKPYEDSSLERKEDIKTQPTMIQRGAGRARNETSQAVDNLRSRDLTIPESLAGDEYTDAIIKNRLEEKKYQIQHEETPENLWKRRERLREFIRQKQLERNIEYQLHKEE